ncbi:MAG TPA: hypothetical protein VF698_04535 [Thermoanaerobaculia bacterium]|jgi:hypothetical protein
MRFAFSFMIVSLVTRTVAGIQPPPYQMLASARGDQFHSYQQSGVTAPNCVQATYPAFVASDSLSSTSAHGVIETNASTIMLEASYSARASGVSVPEGKAEFSNLRIVFQDTVALRSLLKGAKALPIAIVFHVAFEASCNTDCTNSIQLILVDRNTQESRGGTFSRVRSGAFASEQSGGVFSGKLPPQGDVVVALPSRISTEDVTSILSIPAFTVIVQAVTVRAEGGAVFSTSASSGRISLTFRNDDQSLTLPDGTPLRSLGVSYTVCPVLASPRRRSAHH